MSKPHTKQAAALPDQIAIVWHIDDVKQVRPDLTDDQCREVLNHAKNYHDASIGLCWDVLQVHADERFPTE